MNKKKTYSIPHCPKIGDVVMLQRYGEPNHYGYIVGYHVNEATNGTLCKVQWFDSIISVEYPIMLKKVQSNG